MNPQIYILLRSLLGPLLGAGSVAFLIYLLLDSVHFDSKTIQYLRAFRGEKLDTNRQASFGERVLDLLPLSAQTWEMHLAWAQRGGYYPGRKLGNIVFSGLIYAAAGLLVFALKPAPILLLLAAAGFAYPFLALKGKAGRVRRRTIRALPEAASLVAAELAAGTHIDTAVARAAELPGPLAGLLTETVAFSRQTGRPLFSRKPVCGALLEVFSEAGLPALRAFAIQIDEVANKGIDAAELMADTARSLAREYRERVMAEKEQLGGKLTRHVAFHFFMPAVIVILAAFFIPMIALMGGG